MKSSFESFKEAIAIQGDRVPEFAPPSQEYLSWIASLDAAKEIKSLLKQLSLAEEFPLGTNCILSSADVLKENQELSDIFSRDFIVIGGGTSGDLVVIDKRTESGTVGYLNHEDLWDDEVSDPDQSFLFLAENFGSYALKAVHPRGLPLDFHGTLPDF